MKWDKDADIWPKISVLGHTTPILVNHPFVALGVNIHISPWEPFFDFLFLSYSRFRKKNLVDPSKSLPPPLCGGTVCQ